MMLKIYSICLLISSLSQFQPIQCYDIYTICKFNDIWDDFYSYGTNIRQNYIQEKFDAIAKSLLNVTDYELQKMTWYYLKKGSVIHGVYISILNKKQVPSTDPTTALQNAILNAYPNTSILFLKEDKIMVGALQQYKINVICTFNQAWLNDYNDLSSYNSKLFIKDFEVKMKTAFKQIYRLELLFVTFASLSQGSVKADITLYVNETLNPLYDYQIRDSINSSLEIAYGREMSFVIIKIEPYISPIGLIVGCVIGGIIIIVIISVVIIFVIRKRKKPDNDRKISAEENTENTYEPVDYNHIYETVKEPNNDPTHYGVQERQQVYLNHEVPNKKY